MSIWPSEPSVLVINLGFLDDSSVPPTFEEIRFGKLFGNVFIFAPSSYLLTFSFVEMDTENSEDLPLTIVLLPLPFDSNTLWPF